MSKKIVSLLLAIMLMFSSSVFASENDSTCNELNDFDKKIISEKIEGIDILDGYELKEFVNNPLNNKLESNFSKYSSGSVTANDSDNSGTTDDATPENTSPSDAIYIAPNTGVNGNIVVDTEIRWYITQLTEKSKVSQIMTLSETQNFDLFLFKYNQEEGKLDIVTGSVLGKGQQEAFDVVLEAGIYFIGIESKEGTGTFTLYNFVSTLDVDYEVNDTVDNSTVIDQNFNTTINGVLDNPTDKDYYKVEVSNKKVLNVKLISPDNKYTVLYYDGNDYYNIPETCTLEAGTHYFLVYAENSDFSATEPYKLEMNLIHNSKRELLATTNDKSVKLEKSFNGKDYYINGNKIDFSYNFQKRYSNKYGHYSTTMKISKRTNSELLGAKFVNYTTNWEGANSKQKVLRAVLNDVSVYIWRNSGGAYEGPIMNDHFDAAEVIIDPDTGKIIDIVKPNFFYLYGNREYNYSEIGTIYY